MRTLLVVLGVLALIGGVSTYVVHEIGWSTLTGKAWAITYEVTAAPTADTPMQVEYLESPSRYKKETPRSTKVAVPLPWTNTVVINAGERAEVKATPNGDQRLTCRILLDDVKVLASATSAGPGQPVTCKTVTGQ